MKKTAVLESLQHGGFLVCGHNLHYAMFYGTIKNGIKPTF